MKLASNNSSLIMGIINVTPDSFSGDGVAFDFNAMDCLIQRHIDEGADILDVGGHSTRPGANKVALLEEINRVIPAIKHIKRHWPTIKLSVDTFQPQVMRLALELGVDMINDVKAFTVPGALEVIRNSSSQIIIMHMQGEPGFMQDDPKYNHVIDEVADFLAKRMRLIHEQCYIPFENMWIDPGFGFGKRQNDNFKLLANLDQLLDVHFNICAGLSRKSMIGYALGDNDLPRHNATACANLLAWQKGARMFRVHDVQATKDAIMIAEQVAKGLM